MVRVLGVLWLGLSLAACSEAASPRASVSPSPRESGPPAPSVEGQQLKLVVSALDGKPVDLGARSTIQVIDFWATWCRPCLEQMPLLEEIAARYRARGVEFVAVSIDVDKRDVDAFASEHPSAVPIFWDHAGRAAAPYVRLGKWMAIPRTIIVDASGRIVASHANSGRLERSISRTLDRLLAEARDQPGGTNESQASSITETDAAKNDE